jgi:hypothetical protein
VTNIEYDANAVAADTGFPQRLATVLGHRSVRAFARNTGVSDTFLRQCLAGRTDPTRAKLIAIAHTGGTSLEWLATGRGHPGSAAGGAVVHRGHLEAVIETVETVAAEDYLHLAPSEKAHLIHALYAYHETAPSAETVRATLRKLTATAN